MALSPALAPAAPLAAGGMMGGDPMADPAVGAEADTVETTVVTICKNADGTYTVYAGDEPDDDAGAAVDDTGAAASGVAPPAPNGSAPSVQGQPAESIGAALKAALVILQDDASGAGGTDADSQFSAGFGSDKTPTPIGQKY